MDIKGIVSIVTGADGAGFLGAPGAPPKSADRPEECAHLVEAIIANPMLKGEAIRLEGAIPGAPLKTHQ